MNSVTRPLYLMLVRTALGRLVFSQDFWVGRKCAVLFNFPKFSYMSADKKLPLVGLPPISSVAQKAISDFCLLVKMLFYFIVSYLLSSFLSSLLFIGTFGFLIFLISFCIVGAHVLGIFNVGDLIKIIEEYIGEQKRRTNSITKVTVRIACIFLVIFTLLKTDIIGQSCVALTLIDCASKLYGLNKYLFLLLLV